MNIINEFFVSFILIKLYFKFKVCRKIKFPLLWKFYFSKWKFYFSADTNTQNLQELIKLLKLASKNNETFKEREKLLYCPEMLSLITINNHLKEDDIQFIEQYYTYNQNTHEYERNDNLSSSDLEKLSNFFKLKNL